MQESKQEVNNDLPCNSIYPVAQSYFTPRHGAIPLFFVFVLPFFVPHLSIWCLGQTVLRDCGIFLGIFSYILGQLDPGLQENDAVNCFRSAEDTTCLFVFV